MTYRKKFIPLLIAGTMATLIAGCDDSGAEKTGDAPHGTYPLRVALDAMGETFQASVNTVSITQRVNGGESPDKAEVTIEESGLLDDSVATEKTVFTLQLEQGKWQITDRVKTQQCRPDRGHQDFTDQPCR